jgi:transcriptional regulator with XRE-family HTH domain
MDNRAEVSAFLKSRRDKLTPEQAGLPAYGQRRVAGLRRGEVATLAGVSVEYYTRLERGNLGGVSDSVLDALAQALRLNDVERDHLYTLARAANPSSARVQRRPKKAVVRPSVLRLIEGLHDQPAYLRNDRMDILAANPLARALYREAFETQPVNTLRFAFLDPRATRFYCDWQRVVHAAVGALRVAVGKDPYDRDLQNLVGELSARSDAFRTLWGGRDVHVFTDGTKRFHHPVVGKLQLVHEMLDLPGENGLTIAVYSADPGTPAADGLRLLASWAAAQRLDEAAAPADGKR